MAKIHEDELLRSFFRKSGMKKVPDNFTSGVMEQILANPEMEPARKYYHDWWWSALVLFCMLSMYYTGVFNFLDRILTPYFIEIYNMFAGYLSRLADLLPSNIVTVPSSDVLPFILPGIFFILLLDMVMGGRFAAATKKTARSPY